MHKNFFLVAAILGFLGVAFGAFGAHGLRERLSPEMLAVFEIGVRYQMYRVFALLAVAAAIADFGRSRMLLAAGWSFIAGVLIFSGSLYALALTGTGMFGAITPIGGVGLLSDGRVWRSLPPRCNLYVLTATLGRRILQKNLCAPASAVRHGSSLHRRHTAAAAHENLRRVRFRIDEHAHERDVHLVVALQPEPHTRRRIWIESVRR